MRSTYRPTQTATAIGLTPTQITALGAKLIQLDPTGLSGLHPWGVDGLTATQIGQLGARISELPVSAIPSLDANQVKAMTPEQVAALGAKVANLDVAVIDDLSAEQIKSLGAVGLQALTEAQMAALEAERFLEHSKAVAAA